MDGQRKLFKERRELTTLTLEEALAHLIVYLECLVNSSQSLTYKNISTVLISHNARWFDIPVLLQNSSRQFIKKLRSLEVLFGDSLSLFEHLVNTKHPTLCLPDGKDCLVNQSALYKCLFSTTFEAHDALEDVIALQKIIFSSKLELTEEIIVTNCKLISWSDALLDSQYLDRRYQLMKTFETKLYSPTGDGAITRSMAEKIAGSGLSYEDFVRLFDTFGREGLVAILSKPPTTIKQSYRPRVTKTARIISAILRHFESLNNTTETRSANGAASASRAWSSHNHAIDHAAAVGIVLLFCHVSNGRANKHVTFFRVSFGHFFSYLFHRAKSMPTTTYLIFKKIYKAEFVQSRKIRSPKSTLTTPSHIDMVYGFNGDSS